MQQGVIDLDDMSMTVHAAMQIVILRQWWLITDHMSLYLLQEIYQLARNFVMIMVEVICRGDR